VAKKDMEELATQRDSSKPKRITTLVYRSMLKKAAENNLPALIQSTTPGPLTMSKVVNNFRPGGDFSTSSGKST
jgi:hypothetical protein